LQVISDEQLTSAFKNCEIKPFDSTSGPMWRVKMSSGTTEHFDDGDIPADCKYETKLLFCTHHSITDGHSSSRICGYFSNFLNDVVNGVVIDSTQLVTLSDGDILSKEGSAKVAQYFDDNPGEFQRINDEIDTIEGCTPLFEKAFPVSSGSEQPQARNTRYNFDKTITKKFLSKSKENGVTCHSSFFTAVKFALAKMMADNGVKKNNHGFNTSHVMNLRRFWPKDSDSELQFGPNIMFSFVQFDIFKYTSSNFWLAATDFHTLFKDKSSIVDKYTNVFIERFKKFKPPGSGESKPVPTRYYDTNNLGDVTKILNGSFDKTRTAETNSAVLITDFSRSTTTHGGNNICSHVLQSLNGRLLYSLDYNDNFVSPDVAKKYLDSIVEMVTKVATE